MGDRHIVQCYVCRNVKYCKNTCCKYKCTYRYSRYAYVYQVYISVNACASQINGYSPDFVHEPAFFGAIKAIGLKQAQIVGWFLVGEGGCILPWSSRLINAFLLDIESFHLYIQIGYFIIGNALYILDLCVLAFGTVKLPFRPRQGLHFQSVLWSPCIAGR